MSIYFLSDKLYDLKEFGIEVFGFGSYKRWFGYTGQQNLNISKNRGDTDQI